VYKEFNPMFPMLETQGIIIELAALPSVSFQKLSIEKKPEN